MRMHRDRQQVARRARNLRFHRMVQRVADSLPDEIQDLLENVAIVVQDEPDSAVRSEFGAPRREILGLYQGVPMIDRTGGGALKLPDKISIYTGPMLRMCHTRQDLERQIRITLLHEIGHHLGHDEGGLRRMGLG